MIKLLLLMIFAHIVDDYYLQGILASMKQKSWWTKQEGYKSLYKNDYKMNNSESEYILTNKDLGVNFKFESLTQRREDYEGIKNSFREDQNLKYYKEFRLQNGMTGYAYSYYGDLKIVLNVANANETDDESFLSYIVLNTVLKNENGFEIQDFDNKFNIYYNLIKDINYSITERY